MPKPGNNTPSRGVELDISGGPVRCPKSSAIRVSVATGGALSVTYRDSPLDAVSLDFPAPGVYVEKGEFGTIDYDTDSTLVLVPADTVTVLNS